MSSRKAATRTAAVPKAAPARPTAKAAPAASSPAPEAPRLTRSQLSKAETDHFRTLLLEKRKEILGDVGSMESEAFESGSNLPNMPTHSADVGTDNFEQEFTLGLIQSERRILHDIQEALQRLESGTFGICLGTGQAIPKIRLEAVPWAKYTIEYSRALEQGLVRRDVSARHEREDDDDE